MAEVVAALSGCWKLVMTIREVLDRIEQTHDDARALHFLKQKATWFLERLDQGLVGRDTSAYVPIVQSLESLLRDILHATTDYMTMNKISQLLNALRTRRQLLDLNERLRFFVDAYLIETTLHGRNPHVNFEALSHPPSKIDHVKLPDEVEWEIMSQPDKQAYDTSSRILSWQRGVNPSEQEMMEANTIITAPPAGMPAMNIRPMFSPEPMKAVGGHPSYTDNSVNSTKCCQASEDTRRRYTDCCEANGSCCNKDGCFRCLLCLPITLPVFLLDWAITIACCCDSSQCNIDFCCTRCLLRHFPLCQLDICLRGENFDCSCGRCMED